MGLLLPVYSLSAITPTNKQAIYSFNDTQALGLHKTQYYKLHITIFTLHILQYLRGKLSSESKPLLRVLIT